MTERWSLGGYAPGSYHGTCSTCGHGIVGDKRSTQCLICAAKAAAEEIAMLREQLKMKVVLNKIASDAVQDSGGIPFRMTEVFDNETRVCRGVIPLEDWQPTGALRFVRRCMMSILQQEWGSQSGKREWRNVPTAGEEGT